MEEFDLHFELTLILRTLVATVLGAAIGLEREFRGKEAGIRTYAAVALGACTFGIISGHVDAFSQSRIASNIVVGIGFLGAGMIIKHDDKVQGLTTAATIWATAAMGLAVAYGMFILGALTGVLIFAILSLPQLSNWVRKKGKNRSGQNERD
jgi:putative Mg2+ transporter-C (MgtC) family protein